jgi:DME family drug/metabolite transporter
VGTSRAGVATAALVVASVLWGTTGTAASLLPGDVSPLATGASTMAVGGILLFALAARPALAALVDPAARRWLLIGAVGVVVYPLAFYSAMDQAGVAVGNVVALGSGPVFAALFEWLWERRGLSRRWLVSTGIAVVGIALLSTGRREDAATGGDVGTGVLLGLLAGVAYALYSYASTRAIAAGHGARGAMGGMFGIGAIPLVGVLAVVGAPLLQSAANLSIAAYLAVGPMFVAYLLFGFGLTHHRSSVATSVTLVEPLVATLLAVMVVGERLEPVGWIGLAVILAGVTVLIAARQPPRTRVTF